MIFFFVKVISLHFSLLHCFSDTHKSGMNISYVMEDKLEDKLEAQLEDLVNGQNLEDVIDITENAIVEDISEGINIDGVGISNKNGKTFVKSSNDLSIILVFRVFPLLFRLDSTKHEK